MNAFRTKRRRSDLRRRAKYALGAAAFWGEAIELLDGGKADELRQLFRAKGQERIKEYDELRLRLAAIEAEMAAPKEGARL